jgi:hypothetical protein
MAHETKQLVQSLLWLADTGRDGALSLQIRLQNMGKIDAARCEEGMSYIADALDGTVR